MRSWLVFVSFLWLSLSQAMAADTIVIAALGDSLTAGYGLPEGASFAAQLERKLVKDGHNVKVVNHGVSGDTTAGGLSRIDLVLSDKPQIVIVELGANDLMRGVPPETTRTNLEALLAKLQAANVKILIAGLKAPLTLGVEYANYYNRLFADLAAKYRAPLYPDFLEGVYGNPALMQPDGIHPTEEGAGIIVGRIAPYVEKLLK